MKKYLILFAVIVTINACQRETKDQDIGSQYIVADALEYDEEIEMEPPRTAEPPTIMEIEEVAPGSKVIKNGGMTFQVSDLHKAKEYVDTLIKKTKGYIEEDTYRSYRDRIAYSMVLRIPKDNFDIVLKQLESGMGTMEAKSINIQDVTSEYVDINIRLANKLAYLEQYQSILKKAGSIKEILEVQEKIRRLEEEIESQKGRLKYLENQVAYSTLNLEIHELKSRELRQNQQFLVRIGNAFKAGFDGFISFLLFSIRLWPFLILLPIVILVGKRLVRFVKKDEQ